jgi:hypothetical protein
LHTIFCASITPGISICALQGNDRAGRIIGFPHQFFGREASPVQIECPALPELMLLSPLLAKRKS